jgi:hypothetical protein
VSMDSARSMLTLSREHATHRQPGLSSHFFARKDHPGCKVELALRRIVG